MSTVHISTDGACKGNPGPGGWGAILRSGTRERELSGGETLTTNNRMELMAAIQALEALTRPCTVILSTDSVYVKGWHHPLDPRMEAKRLAHRGEKPVANADLWQRLEAAAERHSIDWRWVKGHAGDADNERADRLACDAALVAAKGAGG